MSRKLEEKRQRRLADEQRRRDRQRAAQRRNFVTIGVAILVAALVVGAIVFERSRQSEVASTPIGVPAAQAGCSDIEQPEEQGAQHIPEGQPHPPYNTSPPTSGPHYETPAQAGFYPTPLPPEQLVHNLEHGQIVIWYSPDASDDDVGMLEEYVDRENEKATAEGAEPMLASPYDGLEPGVLYALTGWSALQSCEEVSSEAIDDFRAQFQGKGPEEVTAPFEPE